MSTTDTTTCHHGLGPAHPWEPDRHCPPEPVEPAPDTERDERLREALGGVSLDVVRHGLVYTASHNGDPATRVNAEFGDRAIGALLSEVARLDAVVTAVRELHQPRRRRSGERVIVCECCLLAYPCPTVRALDGGAA